MNLPWNWEGLLWKGPLFGQCSVRIGIKMPHTIGSCTDTDEGRLGSPSHLRDVFKPLAFGPGFMHFLPRREWLRVAASEGLTVERETRMTPFGRVFVMQKVALLDNLQAGN